jgi:oligo-1,6-glucosidase
MLALIQATMTGTLFLYQGQEIGMINAPRSWGFEEYKCIKSVNYHNAIKTQPNNESALSEALDGMQLVARDHARVPMQWDSSPHAGFCGPNAKPWMRVVDSFAEINVADQIGRKDSVLEFWKGMLVLRKEHKDLFVYGNFKTIEQGDELMVFTKTSGGKTSLTVANLTYKTQKWQMPEEVSSLTLKLLINNKGSSKDELLPYEGRVYISR